MANFKYFADVNGETFELSSIRYDSRQRGAAQFSGRASNGELLTANRYVEYKRNPSKHVCDARCLNATGKVMKCECSCGGKNHGKGDSLMDKPVSLAEVRAKNDKERYAALVLNTFDKFEHQDKRDTLERRAEVERAARERL